MGCSHGACSQEADLRAPSCNTSPCAGQKTHTSTSPHMCERSTPFLNTRPHWCPKLLLTWQQAQMRMFKTENLNPKFPAKSLTVVWSAKRLNLWSRRSKGLSRLHRAELTPGQHAQGVAELSFLCSSLTVHRMRKSPGLLPAHMLCNI